MEYFTTLVKIMKEISDKHGFWKVAFVFLLAIAIWRFPEFITAIRWW
ncbi:MAG: hypothetical protein KGV51_01055 [Moraxellaceae bacterium]|nr:hypothetical protein [Moraxellaceae bacterium]